MALPLLCRPWWCCVSTKWNISPINRSGFLPSLPPSLLPFPPSDPIPYPLSLRCVRRNDTGITDSGELDRTLLSLSCGKPGTRILIKEPKSKEVHPSDTFRFDENYSNKLFRIKINTIQVPLLSPSAAAALSLSSSLLSPALCHSLMSPLLSPQLKETVEEVEKTREEVFRDRQYEVDAIIVRLMKARKKLTHSQLMSEIFSQLKSVLPPPLSLLISLLSTSLLSVSVQILCDHR
jgi:hypothetical protein